MNHVFVSEFLWLSLQLVLSHVRSERMGIYWAKAAAEMKQWGGVAGEELSMPCGVCGKKFLRWKNNYADSHNPL